MLNKQHAKGDISGQKGRANYHTANNQGGGMHGVRLSVIAAVLAVGLFETQPAAAQTATYTCMRWTGSAWVSDIPTDFTRSESDNNIVCGNITSIGASTINAIAIGTSANIGARAHNAIAFGNSATVGADAIGAFAAGSSAQAHQTGNVAIGNQAKAYGSSPIRYGNGTTATPYAGGSEANQALGNVMGSVVIGSYAQAGTSTTSSTGGPNVAIGVAIGAGAYAGANDTALGVLAVAKGGGSTAFGSAAPANASGGTPYNHTQTMALAQNSTAIATGARAVGIRSTAIGDHAQASATSANGNSIVGGIALGAGSVADRSAATTTDAISGTTVVDPANVAQAYDPSTGTTAAAGSAIANTNSTAGALSIGTSTKGAGNNVPNALRNAIIRRQITNVAGGTADTDAVNIAQLKAVASTANAGWNIGNDAAQLSNVYNVGSGARVDFVSSTPAASNVKVTQTSGTAPTKTLVTIAASPMQYTTTNTAAGSNAPNADQFTATDQVTLVGADGQTNKGVQINNVKAATLNATSLQAVNGSQLYKVADSVASLIGGSATVNPNGTITGPTYFTLNGVGYNTVYDAIKKLAEGWNLQATGSGAGGGGSTGGPGGTGSGGPTSIQPGDTVNLKAGNNMVLTQADKVGTTVTTTIATSMNPVFDTVTTSGLTVTSGSMVDMGNNKVTKVGDATINSASQDAVNGRQIHAISTSVSNALGGGSTVNADGSVSAPSYTITTNPATGASTTVNNVGDALGGLNTAVNQPLTFAGDSGTNVTRKLGSTINVVGGATGPLTDGNIGVVADGNSTMTVKLAREVKGLTSISATDAAGNTTTMSGGGVTVAPAGGGQTVTLGPTGLNNGGNTINNVAPGEVSPTSTQAINGSQLYNALQQTAGGINTQINNRFNAMSKELNAGIASGIAVASIPQVTRPGAVGVGMGGGSYMGQTGLAVGVSGMTDNGNWIFKGNVITNTSGHVGVGVGVLRQW